MEFPAAVCGAKVGEAGADTHEQSERSSVMHESVSAPQGSGVMTQVAEDEARILRSEPLEKQQRGPPLSL